MRCTRFQIFPLMAAPNMALFYRPLIGYNYLYNCLRLQSVLVNANSRTNSSHNVFRSNISSLCSTCHPPKPLLTSEENSKFIKRKPPGNVSSLFRLVCTREQSTNHENAGNVVEGHDSDSIAKTHFGFETVPETEKVEKGDIAFRYMKYRGSSTTAGIGKREVTVCDINEHMLKVGERRANEQYLTEGISWLQGNAESLPVSSNTYDAFTIAFGIRNCTNIPKVLSEAYRVLKPGGRFMCLEFSEMTIPVLQSLYDLYSFQVIPVLGHVIAKDWNSYQYLVESIRRFPNQSTFADWIRDAGFSNVSWNDLSLGIVAIHSGFKI
ncbi:ubiquinone/menaquinone biosynthesis C-methyltransferase UbiE-like isoform X3 [Watersipora subatra]|uniref:ubiquinone/menaquinone biosynthesis C-methyltransferase UbiE-like isoform X3 n=1 Tax=Watersipora subatra TaxID=2589382 RepID=UPI00355B059B